MIKVLRKILLQKKKINRFSMVNKIKYEFFFDKVLRK